MFRRLSGAIGGDKPKQPWLRKTEGEMIDFMRRPVAGIDRGVDHPSRRKLRELLRQGESVLEIGCNGAVEYEGLRRYGPRVAYTGVDLAPGAVRAAQGLFPEGTFRVGDVLGGLDFPDRSFDTVFCRHLLEHLPDIDRALPEMLRLARDRIIVILFLPLEELRGRRKLDRRYEGKATYTHTYDRSYFYGYLAACPRVTEYRHLGPYPPAPNLHNVLIEAWLRVGDGTLV